MRKENTINVCIIKALAAATVQRLLCINVTRLPSPLPIYFLRWTFVEGVIQILILQLFVTHVPAAQTCISFPSSSETISKQHRNTSAQHIMDFTGNLLIHRSISKKTRVAGTHWKYYFLYTFSLYSVWSDSELSTDFMVRLHRNKWLHCLYFVWKWLYSHICILTADTLL